MDIIREKDALVQARKSHDIIRGSETCVLIVAFPPVSWFIWSSHLIFLVFLMGKIKIWAFSQTWRFPKCKSIYERAANLNPSLGKTLFLPLD